MRLLSLLLFLLPTFYTKAQTIMPDDQSEWWKRNNLRVIQMNLPAYEAANLHAQEILEDLQNHHANTLIINAGGIMAFYASKLDFHYINPYMKDGELAKIIGLCHENNIRVIVRFDFSRADKSIFDKHPDWFYLSPKGERIINTDKFVVSINAPYVQQKAFDIIGEVLDTFPVDGIFLNMPGYQTRNPYENVYHGIDQNPYDQKAFAEWSNGLALPLVEDKSDSVFLKYEQFKKESIVKWSQKLHKTVKKRGQKIAICTYLEDYVDIIRHESQAHGLPYWPYTGFDNTNHIEESFPNKIVSNASIQQISFQSRFNAVEPEETAIRYYGNLAAGSGTDISLMGDMRAYEDQRNFETVAKINKLHQENEEYFGAYQSIAKIALIAPGYWPSGEEAEEYRGLQMMLKEAHLPFDIIQDNQINALENKLIKYSLLIFPDIKYLGTKEIATIKKLVDSGIHVVATNKSMSDNPQILKDLFGAKIEKSSNDGSGNYLSMNNLNIFSHFEGQTMVHLKYNLGLYKFDEDTEPFLPILDKGRPGPPEMIGGHDDTGFKALGIKNHGNAKAALLPFNIGKMYYRYGYEQHKQIILDLLSYLNAPVFEQIETNAHPRVDLVCQEFMKNTSNITIESPFHSDGHIIHLINMTGFSGNTYFSNSPQFNIEIKLKLAYKPQAIKTLVSQVSLPFNYRNGELSLLLPKLSDYEAIVVEKP